MVNAGFLWDFQPQGALSPAVPGEESERVLRHWRVWRALQTRGVTGGREGVVGGRPRVLAANQRVTGWPPRRSTYFRGKTPAHFDVDVYRKSTGDPRPGKSSAKGLAASEYRTPGASVRAATAATSNVLKGTE